MDPFVKKAIPLVGIGLTVLALFYVSVYLPPESMFDYAPLLSFLLLFFMVLLFFLEFESATLTSKEVALVGILSAITAASRIPFAAVPSIQPCTFLIIAAGLVFGPLSGAMVGALTPAVSNMFLGQGPWTVWQMVGWGMVGMVAGLIGTRREEVSVTMIAVLGFIMGLAFSLFQDVGSWIWLYGLDPTKFLAVMSAGLPFTLLHAVGNVLFALVLGKPVMFSFRRFQKRFHISYKDHHELSAGS